MCVEKLNVREDEELILVETCDCLPYALIVTPRQSTQKQVRPLAVLIFHSLKDNAFCLFHAAIHAREVCGTDSTFLRGHKSWQ